MKLIFIIDSGQSHLIDMLSISLAWNRRSLQTIFFIKNSFFIKGRQRKQTNLIHTRDWKQQASTNLSRRFECWLNWSTCRKFLWPFVARTRNNETPFIGNLVSYTRECKFGHHLKTVFGWELNYPRDLCFRVIARRLWHHFLKSTKVLSLKII